MKSHDYEYLKLVQRVLDEGRLKTNRTGVNAISVIDGTMTFDLSDGTIPLLTTKKMHIPGIIHELLWYISGSSNIKYLQDNNIRIWNEWADDDGELGPLYGPKLRNWNGIDQLSEVINLIKTDPDSRRMVVSYWDPAVLPDTSLAPRDNPPKGNQALPPCHYTWQCFVEEINGDKVLSLKLVMRSNDLFLGNPYNISQYSILLHILCKLTGCKPGKFIFSGGDIHIYANHIEQITEQLSREPFLSPTVTIGDISSIDELRYEDIVINNYKHHPLLTGKVAV